MGIDNEKGTTESDATHMNTEKHYIDSLLLLLCGEPIPVTVQEDGTSLAYHVFPPAKYFGRIVGKKGSFIEALRAVVQRLTAGRPASLQLVETERAQRSPDVPPNPEWDRTPVQYLLNDLLRDLGFVASVASIEQGAIDRWHITGEVPQGYRGVLQSLLSPIARQLGGKIQLEFTA
jgi:predicted RNA-binding protein YlqC (UPF0109 family)